MQTKESLARRSVGRITQATFTLIILGGICADCFYTLLKPLVVGGKNIIKSRQRRRVGGGAGNVAVGHRNLDADAEIHLLARVGDDTDGAALRTWMEERGITMPCDPVPSTPTSWSHIYTHPESPEGTIVSDPGARELPVPVDLVNRAMSAADACCLVAPARSYG